MQLKVSQFVSQSQNALYNAIDNVEINTINMYKLVTCHLNIKKQRGNNNLVSNMYVKIVQKHYRNQLCMKFANVDAGMSSFYMQNTALYIENGI